MKSKKLRFIFVAILLIAAGSYGYFFAGPFRFVDRALQDESLSHLHAGISDGAPWGGDPAAAAYEYLYWWPEMDKPDRSKLKVSVSYRTVDEAIVTIIDRDCQGDSTFATCDRLTLKREGRAWLPLRHQAAWQGRGRFGWTTEATL